MPAFHYYGASVSEFLVDSPERVVGELVLASGFDTRSEQAGAWREQIRLLQAALVGVSGYIYFEFTVPRIGARIDVALVTRAVIFALEFKIGAPDFLAADLSQAWDYALDLKNFHLGSRGSAIVPVLVATGGTNSAFRISEPAADGVYSPVCCRPNELRFLIDRIGEYGHRGNLGPEWACEPYSPSPTIIEAARALYSSHSVQAIARHGADAKNLGETTDQIDKLISRAKDTGSKYIIFVTGVPGAGKTLVGLDAANKRRDSTNATHAVFLSGNGPLVEVLKEALVRDDRSRKLGVPVTKSEARRKVKAFIQNIHHFRDAGIIDRERPPADHVVIFDEAQRAWDEPMTQDFLKRKKGITGIPGSEPELLLEYVDRHSDWAVVVCLVGNGQEINRGEAGIATWLDALCSRFPHWHAFISSELREAEPTATVSLARLEQRKTATNLKSLHLPTSMRSFRASMVSSFVSAVLKVEQDVAEGLLGTFHGEFPIVLTRDLNAAKRWMRSRARGSERMGLVATSGAMRLKPHAIDVRVEINPVHWFLNPDDDIRSSSFLEDAATEFQVQGLELDWVCVNWDADLRISNGKWDHRQFVGSRWTRVIDHDRQRYLVNAYRVLLTRARQGLAIFVSPGNPADATRLPEFYDPTFHFLKSLGIPVLEVEGAH